MGRVFSLSRNEKSTSRYCTGKVSAEVDAAKFRAAPRYSKGGDGSSRLALASLADYFLKCQVWKSRLDRKRGWRAGKGETMGG